MRRTVVVGAETGSGVARVLAASGHRVVLANPWTQSPPAPDGVERVVSVDLSDRNSVFEMFDSADAVLGGIDTLVFAAASDAAFRSSGVTGQVDLSRDAWQGMVHRILYGGVYSTQAALRRMVAQQSGRIIYLCADNAVDGRVSDPAVAASSCGLLALSSSLATSAFLRGVTLNAILVGVPYEITGGLPPMPDEQAADDLPYLPKTTSAILRQRLLHRLSEARGIGWAESVAAMLNHLCSDGASLVAGSTLRLANIGEDPALVRWSY